MGACADCRDAAGYDVIDLRFLQHERILRQRAIRYLAIAEERRSPSLQSVMAGSSSTKGSASAAPSPRMVWVCDVELKRKALDPVAAEVLRLVYQLHWSERQAARELGLGVRALTAIADQALVAFGLAVADMPLDPVRWVEVAA